MSHPGLGTWIERRARRSPSQLALRADGLEVTFAEFAGSIGSLASEFIERGIEPGDRVAYHGRNHASALTSLFATAAIGGIWVPIHPSRPEDDVIHIVRDSEPRLLIRADPDTHPAAGVPELDAGELERTDEPPALPQRNASPDDLVILAYTSGTTGDPKGVMLTEANVYWNAIQMVLAAGLTMTDVAIASAPLTRMGGLGVVVLPTLFAGGTIVLPPDLGGSSILRTIERDRVTVLFENPDVLAGAAAAPEWGAADLSSIRTAVVGGGLAPEPLLRAYIDRDVELRHGYGLTEAAPVVSLLDPNEAARRPTSVGKPVAFVEVRAVRPDGSDCDPGEVGEWVIRGPNVTSGYWRLPPDRDVDGWFHTGDVGSIDVDGYLTFVDRASSALRIDGEIVYPATVEIAMYGMRGIADAAATEVDGRLVAAVVAEAPIDTDAILASLRGSLPPPAVPSEIRPVEAIPRNASGKVRREELRALLTSGEHHGR